MLFFGEALKKKKKRVSREQKVPVQHCRDVVAVLLSVTF